MLSVLKPYKSYIIAIATIVICIIIVKQCEGDPRIIEKTKTEYVKVTDTVTKTIIDTVPKTVYVERVKTIKGKDSIIYKDNPTDSTIIANKYNTKLESNNATANLEITTTGQLLDVNGTINYTKEIKTIEKKPKQSFSFFSRSCHFVEKFVCWVFQLIPKRQIDGLCRRVKKHQCRRGINDHAHVKCRGWKDGMKVADEVVRNGFAIR